MKMKKYILNKRDPPSQLELLRMPNTGLWSLECGVASWHLRGCEGSPATGIKRLGDGNVKVSHTRLVILVP